MTLESVFKTAQVAELIGVSASSMRKYALAVEKYGGKVQKDDKGDRIYTESDLSAFRHLRKLLAGGMTIERAAEQTALLMKGEQETKREAGFTLAKNDGELLREALTEIKELRGMIEAQTALIEARAADDRAERVKERQAFQLALQAIEEAKEETAAVEVKEAEVKPGLFGRLFGKRK